MKVDDIRPDQLMAGQAAAEAADIDWLRHHREEFVGVACPACGSEQRTALYEKKAMPQVRCDICKTQYASPRPTPELLAEFYASSKNYAYFAEHIFPASKEARRQNLFKPRAEMVAALTKRFGVSGGTLIEVGAAYGFFCDEIRKLNVFDRIVGIEPTPNLAEICRDQGIDIIESPYEKIVLDEKASVIAHFEVIEHLFNPSDFLKWCFDSLAPGGLMVATCPNIAGFESVTLGEESNAVDHEHINLFSPQSLCLLLEKQGFKILEVSTPGRLDIDLVRRAVQGGRYPAKNLDPIIEQLIFCQDEAVQDRFLKVLQDANLTGNVMAVAKRPEGV